MKIIKPKKLESGDLIGIISPASSTEDLIKIEKGVRYLESLGYKVEVGKNVGKYHGYLAGEDHERLNDLNYMFGKKEVKAIICVRGGYGTPRLLDKIDYAFIRANPKIFVGHSDITAVQMAFLAKAGLVTFAGPMLAVDFADNISAFTEEMFWALVTSNKKYGKIQSPDDEKIFSITKGMAKGKITGGNLALIESLIGTPYLPSFNNNILLLEEVGEVPYRIDRMLNHLRLAKVFSKLCGVILGAFVDCNENDPSKRTLTLGEVIADYFNKLETPVVYNFKHGHIRDSITIPFGISIKVNSSRSNVEILESAVV
ncbi:MAG TPA: LD-carboxypeptidase [Ignavibacteria bacterium]|nr:LD-carboxypeptidase [Ignavibacteria bacterium]